MWIRNSSAQCGRGGGVACGISLRGRGDVKRGTEGAHCFEIRVHSSPVMGRRIFAEAGLCLQMIYLWVAARPQISRCGRLVRHGEPGAHNRAAPALQRGAAGPPSRGIKYISIRPLPAADSSSSSHSAIHVEKRACSWSRTRARRGNAPLT